MRQNKPEPPRNYSRSHATILMNVYFLEPAPKIEQIYYQCLQTKSSHGRRSISRRKPGFQKPTIHMKKLILSYLPVFYFLAIKEERYLVAPNSSPVNGRKN